MPYKLLEESLKRRSYRKFLNKKVDEEILKACLLTASTAPSGANKQPYHFYVVTNEDVKALIRREAEKVEKIFYEEKISKNWEKDLEILNVTYEKPFLTQAPCLIVCFKELYTIDSNQVKHSNYYINESSLIAIGLLINALRNAALASLTYTPMPNNFLSDILGVSKNLSPIMIIACGYPDLSYDLPDLKRKELKDFTTFIK